MPIITVGNIRITTTFKSGIRYNKKGEMVSDNWMYVSYRNLQTGKTATNAELAEAGIKHRQRPAVKLTDENADFLFNRAIRAEAGELKPKNYANLLGSKSFGVPTSEQTAQYKDALKKMFEDSNPSEEEQEKWNAMVDSMTEQEVKQFYDRYQRDINKGFKGYHSKWLTTDTDEMTSATTKDVLENYKAQSEVDSRDIAKLQKVNRDTIRPKLMNALESFLRDKGKQSTLDRF